MRFTYDPKYNIAYLKFQEKSAEVNTLKVSDELNRPHSRWYNIRD